MLLLLAIHGVGITLAEERFAEPHVKSGQLVRVLPEWQLPPALLRAGLPGWRLMPARTRVLTDALRTKFGSFARRSRW